MKIEVKLSSAEKAIKTLGLNPGGHAQAFHTRNVANRIGKYQPYRSNGSVPKATQTGVDLNRNQVVIRGPHIRYLNEGKVMVGKGNGKKQTTNKDLQYTKTTNKLAGPHWARRLNDAEGSAMAGDLMRYYKLRGGT